MDYFTKLTSEVLEIEVNFSNSLATGERISSATVVSYLNNSAVTDIIFAKTVLTPSVYIKLQGGNSGDIYTIKTSATTSNSNILVKEITMLVITEIPYDKQLCEITNIGSISDEEVDNVKILMKQILSGICDYCNNDFIVNYEKYENVNASISDRTITCNKNITIPFKVNDWIRIKRSDYNDGLYKIIAITDNILIVDEQLICETSNFGIYLVKFPSSFNNLILNFVNKSKNTNIKKEKIDDTEIEYFEQSPNNFIKNNTSLLGNYRKLYKRR